MKAVFRNFAMYLVDFFTLSRLTPEKIKSFVRLEGIEHMEQALRMGKGAIGLTAHLGNFELAAAVLSLMGFPVNAVVLIHQNSHVDAFFRRQRTRVGVKAIPLKQEAMREFFEASLGALRRNEILALVGDRDFFNRGLRMPLFGRTLRVPAGPAAFSLKTGAPIVPGFLIRDEDTSYRFILEPPICAPKDLPLAQAQRQLSQSCLDVMARYIRLYPTQWYMFLEFWKPNPSVIL